MIRFFVVSALALITIGCAFHKTPFIAYTDKNHPLSDTSVFSTAPRGLFNPPRTAIAITGIDGVSRSCFFSEAGCPVWVRVLPGDHTFSTDFIKVNVTDMRPRHVYVAHIKSVEGRMVAEIEDLGENPKYGFVLGVVGLNAEYCRVVFKDNKAGEPCAPL